MTRRTNIILLTLILLSAAALRIIHIGDQSLWVDEGFAYYAAQQTDLPEFLKSDTHPPLYYASLSVWQSLAGRSELALRYFSTLPSMLTVAVVFLLAGEFVRTRSGTVRRSVVPLLAALLMALVDVEIFLSQEVRHYTWHVFFAAASMLFFLRWIRTQTRRDMALWFIFTTLLIYTHYVGSLTGFVQGLYALIFLRGKMRIQAIGVLVLSALCLMPWLLTIGVEQIDNDGVNWRTPTTLFDIRDKWFGLQWPLMIGLFIFGTIRIIYARRTHMVWRPVKSSVLLLMWAIIPVALIYLGNEYIPILAPRRMSQITPAVMLLIAFGLANFRQPARGFLIIVIVVNALTSVDFYRIKPPWREVGQQTASYVHPDDLVLIDIGGGDFPLWYYYTRLLPEGTAIHPLKIWRDYQGEDSYNNGLPELLKQYDTVWMMHWSPDTSAFARLNEAGFSNTAQLKTPHDIAINVTIDLIVYRYDRIDVSQTAGEFENGMILGRASTFDDNPLRVDLLWSAETTPDADYTVSAKLINADGALVAQVDSQPADNQRPTSSWNNSEWVYDSRNMTVVDGQNLNPGVYEIWIEVYLWRPEGITPVMTTSGDRGVLVGKLNVN